MATTRDQFIETTGALLEAQGYHATGLNQVVRESGAPKGSLYYHFPDGKEELAAEAIERTGLILAERIHGVMAGIKEPAQAVSTFIEKIAEIMEASDFQSGGPLSTVAMETATSSARINQACQEAYRRVQEAFGEKLLASGMEAGRAAEMALVINAAIEGGILLSRTFHSGEPLRQVAKNLHWILATTRQNENGD